MASYLMHMGNDILQQHPNNVTGERAERLGNDDHTMHFIHHHSHFKHHHKSSIIIKVICIAVLCAGLGIGTYVIVQKLHPLCDYTGYQNLMQSTDFSSCTNWFWRLQATPHLKTCKQQFAGQDPSKRKKSRECCYLSFTKDQGTGGMRCPTTPTEARTEDVQSICVGECQKYMYDTGYAHPSSCTTNCGCKGTDDEALCKLAVGPQGDDGSGVCVCGNNTK